jgi:RimJ/RimL family protein N-acetyltransferase
MNPLSPPTLETARLKLRPYCEADIAELLPLIGSREVAATTLRIAHPYTGQNARDFLLLQRQPGRLWLAITLRKDGSQIGGIGLMVDQEHQHGGSATGRAFPTGAKATPPRPRVKCCATDSKIFNSASFA